MAPHRLVAASALAIASLALIGAGAGARYTDSATSGQRITAGKLDLTLSSTAAGSSVASSGKGLTLGAWGPTNATFTTGTQPVRFTNTGTAAARRVVITLARPVAPAGSRAATALAKEVCVTLTAAGSTVYDGPLRSMGSTTLSLDLAPRASFPASLRFYAGYGACPALTARAMGGSITPRFTATFSG